ncbi:hypothetical protein [Streptomyces sp. NPDC006784]|uniref:hypothetical protein n=1 Tax=Streptomyces sp. NPDC006784 TaxID=3364764 RepID=UPI00368EBFC0
MADEPTLGEVVRRLEAVHADLKEDVRNVGGRLDSKVSIERYDIEWRAREDALRGMSERIRAIEEARDQEHRQMDADRRAADDRRRADRRLLFTALIAPILLLLLQTYLATRGAGQ